MSVKAIEGHGRGVGAWGDLWRYGEICGDGMHLMEAHEIVASMLDDALTHPRRAQFLWQHALAHLPRVTGEDVSRGVRVT